MTPENISALKQSLGVVESILKKKQDEYIKAYLYANKLHPNVAGSIVKFEYSQNYLNLPKVKSL